MGLFITIVILGLVFLTVLFCVACCMVSSDISRLEEETELLRYLDSNE